MVFNVKISQINTISIYNLKKRKLMKWPYKSSHRRCSVKKVFSEILQNSQENTCARDSFLTLAQVFSCEFYKISKNTFLQNTTGRLLLTIHYLFDTNKLTGTILDLESCKSRCMSWNSNTSVIFSEHFR